MCDTHCTTPKDLNRHLEKIFGGAGLCRLPKASTVKATSTTAATNHGEPAGASLPAVYNAYVPFTGTLTEFINSKAIEKAKKDDSVKDMSQKLMYIIRRLENEFKVIRTNGVIIRNFWGDVIQVLKNFFENDPKWMTQLRVMSIAKTGDQEIFSPVQKFCILCCLLQRIFRRLCCYLLRKFEDFVVSYKENLTTLLLSTKKI